MKIAAMNDGNQLEIFCGILMTLKSGLCGRRVTPTLPG